MRIEHGHRMGPDRRIEGGYEQFREPALGFALRSRGANIDPERIGVEVPSLTDRLSKDRYRGIRIRSALAESGLAVDHQAFGHGGTSRLRRCRRSCKGAARSRLRDSAFRERTLPY